MQGDRASQDLQEVPAIHAVEGLGANPSQQHTHLADVVERQHLARRAARSVRFYSSFSPGRHLPLCMLGIWDGYQGHHGEQTHAALPDLPSFYQKRDVISKHNTEGKCSAGGSTLLSEATVQISESDDPCTTAGQAIGLCVCV